MRIETAQGVLDFVSEAEANVLVHFEGHQVLMRYHGLDKADGSDEVIPLWAFFLPMMRNWHPVLAPVALRTLEGRGPFVVEVMP